MKRAAVLLTSFVTLIALGGLPPALAGGSAGGSPGAAGIGDNYFPTDGNGGYDAKHYTLDVRYDPETDRISGKSTMTAVAKKDLSRFNLDLDGLKVHSISVNHQPATWQRKRGELVITPSKMIANDGYPFVTTVTYSGVPKTLDEWGGPSGFVHTDDGADVMGQPHGAATWYPVNDHPSDRASYTFHVTVPKGLTAVANGVLLGRHTQGGQTTWNWDAKEPMASYLTTATIGEFKLHSYAADGVKFWDAIDPDLFDPVAVPTTGSQFALSQVGDLSYKRLSRVIDVPAGGGSLTFTVTRSTEEQWDFFFVEAVRPGAGDWTTLPDANGHTSRSTGNSCPFWLGLHPFLKHYQTKHKGGCKPTGSSGKWRSATGASETAENWAIDLSDYAGQKVRVSFTYASDDIVQADGVYIDDIATPGGPGTTSFEADGNVRDGWADPGAPKGSAPNPNDWTIGSVDDTPPPLGERAASSLARQPEILRFLSKYFGPYPFTSAGGIVDDTDGLNFALETQTRPNFSKVFFQNQEEGDAVVIHEDTHQWFGDSLAVRRWRNIWLNEGFATYAEWMWSEHEGLGTAQENFDGWYGIPKRSGFWKLAIGNPGPDRLFDIAVYYRGAMALHALRLKIGDQAFFETLKRWAQEHQGGLVAIPQFRRLAESISGKKLVHLFDVWLYTPEKPNPPKGLARSSSATATMSTFVHKQVVNARRS